MTRRKDDSDKPLVLTPSEIDEILSKRLIANLATFDNDGGIHLLPMWFLRKNNDICIPTSTQTHKYRNLKARPYASVMIDVSREGLNLKGVLIRGTIELVHGEEAQRINRSIHLKYVKPEALSDTTVASYLSKGDNVTVRVHMDDIISWNLADSKPGKAVHLGGWFYSLDG